MKLKAHLILLTVVVSLGATPLWSAVQSYEVDAGTSALFLFNEENGALNATDEVVDDTLTLWPSTSSEFGFGFPSAEGFGTGFLGGDSILRNPRFGEDRMQGEDGAFTYEAIFRVDSLDPIPSGGSARTILGWGQGGNFGQMRLNIANDTQEVSIQVYNRVGALNGGVNINVPVPTEGTHAFQLGKFYHFAFVYDGNDGTEGNVKLYWTALDSNATEAQTLSYEHLEDAEKIGQDQQWDFLSNTWFAVGGDISGTKRLFPGLIDNVRISSIARQPDEFIFFDDGSGPSGSLTPGEWQVTDIGYVYGFTSLWGYSVFMGPVYMVRESWLYQVHFGWLYLASSNPTGDGSGTNYWFHSSSLGWVTAYDNNGGWFQNQNVDSQWEWNNFIEPNP